MSTVVTVKRISPGRLPLSKAPLAIPFKKGPLMRLYQQQGLLEGL
jgi:hypothetical protein